MKAYEFHARPVDPRVYQLVVIEKKETKQLTKPVGINLKTSKRAAVERSIAEESHTSYEFHARPVPKNILLGPTDPPFIFTEDYQTELMMHHHKTFDVLKTKGFFIGEHIWNFADFLTLQQINSGVGNKKGIFTRERQPKASAKLLRCRYHTVANRPIIGSIAYCRASDMNY